jgi:hypothetical protein
MMNAVTYILENDATVQGLVRVNSRDDKHKIYPVAVPESETHPFVVCRILNAPRTGKSCYYSYSVQVMVFHDSYDDMNTLSVAVRNALEGQAAGTVNGVDFSYLNYSDQSDDYSKDRSLFFRAYVFEGIAD